MQEPIEAVGAATAASPSRSSGLWGTLKEAVRGSEQNFTEGGIGRAIFLLSVPMVLEVLMESLFGIVNVYWVAHLGKEQAAAVGVTESLLTIVITVAMGLSMGTTAMVARRIGEGDREGAARVAEQAILLGVLISIPIGVAGALFNKQLFHVMNAESGVSGVGGGYLTVIFGANVVIMLLFMINAIFRGAGDAAIAMRVLWTGNLINLVLDPCLIFGLGPFPELGVTGSAVATTIGRGVAVIYQFISLSRGKGRVPVRLGRMLPNFGLMKTLLRISLGGMFQILVATAAWMLLMSIVGLFGAAAQAGYTIAIRIIWVTLLPSWGMSNAGATLVGQNLGAQKPERAEKSVWLAGHSNAVFLTAVAVIFITFPEFLIRIFTQDQTVIPYGVDALRYISYGYIFYGYGMVMSSAFNGAGDTYTPTVINLVCFWLIQIPLAYTLAKWTGLETKGVFLAITIAESILAVIAMLAFRRGKWKAQKV
ncbi:MAG TPA: MATE family efflux transporter [Blastocatellia bacterium]|nr:MATE family efflux transporter [Blastocatellia bacterium]